MAHSVLPPGPRYSTPNVGVLVPFYAFLAREQYAIKVISRMGISD